jgi:type IV pilus assembly protein PilV
MISHKFQHGVSLIESMIALLVISVGLLGIAALQISSVSLNSSAYWHSQAVLYAHNMADRIRANEVKIKDYIGIDTKTAYTQNCKTAECNTEEMRLADAADWSKQVSSLPSGRGIIRSEAGSNQLDVVVLWDDEGTGATGTKCSNKPKVDLTCYTITMSTQ